MPGNGAAAAGARYGDLVVTSLLGLGAVCIAAFIAVRLFGRLLATGRARGAHLLDVVARVPLEPRRSLYVVEVAGKTLLVGTSEMGLSVLSELDASEVRSRVAAQPSFGELVRAAWKRRIARRSGDPPTDTTSDIGEIKSSGEGEANSSRASGEPNSSRENTPTTSSSAREGTNDKSGP